jgi:hypothetical protein
MVATLSVAASSAYYARGSKYYRGAKEPDGVWYAPAGDLGRVDAATVRAKEFARLYEGRGVDGQALISNAGGKADQRVPAFDLTFSARSTFYRKTRTLPVSSTGSINQYARCIDRLILPDAGKTRQQSRAGPNSSSARVITR